MWTGKSNGQDGGNVDQRYYLSLVALGAILVVAWVMSQFHDASELAPTTQPPTNRAPLETSNSLTTEITHLSADPTRDPKRSLVAAAVQPLIPGLLDESEHVLDPASAAMEPPNRLASESEGDSAILGPVPVGNDPMRGLTGVPLRRISSGPSQPTPVGPTGEVTIVTEDGSSPRSKPLPSFSMPNTQALARDRPDVQGPLEPTSQPVGSQDLPPSSAGLRPIVMGHYRELENQLADPKPLPGDRHILRPIIRAKAPVQAPAQAPAGIPANSPLQGSEFPRTLDAIWETPMPGVKRRAPNGASTTTPTSPISPNTAPATGAGLSSAGDPLFVRVGANSGPSGGLANQDRDSTMPLVRPESYVGSTPTTAPIRSSGRPRPQSGDYIWHVIQQNQSLESISFQYQGDANFVSRLLELNRDRLTDPQLLPIGKAIRIPIR
ncbi:MAG: hypothetical protein Q8M16_08030 [Pirellulaceae bacterium]|nr:hypothetical protein [Pirellulaceae bacterium]